jgi:hypothetical protein
MAAVVAGSMMKFVPPTIAPPVTSLQFAMLDEHSWSATSEAEQPV